jgi:hypothetical protein
MTDSEKIVPPYVPWSTFTSFIDDLKKHTPKRIDRSVVGAKRSWADATKLLATLRFLRLTDDQGNITETLRRYLSSDTTQAPEVLREMLRDSYGQAITLDELEDATPQLFEERFAVWGKGDTIRKARKFFLEAAKAAQVPLSPRLVTRASPTRRPAAKNSLSKPAGKSTAQDASGSTGNGGQTQIDLDSHDADLYDKVLQRFREKPEGFEYWLEGRLELLRERAEGAE